MLALGAIALVSGSDGSGPSDFTVTDAGSSRANEARALFDAIGPNDSFCSAAVLQDDEVVYAEAFGSIDGERVTPDTEVDIASVSKQFTGVATELLIDRGDLSGSDIVVELVPASAPATDDLTVDELLTHTSGLADYTDLLPEEYDEPTTQRGAIDAIAESEPTGLRGSFDYSNSNYVLLAEVVESVTGSSLGDFLDDEVFGPLDLEMVLDPRGAWQQVGDGSVWTTPTELVRWSRQYWDQTLEGPNLVSAMFDPEVNASEEGGDTYGSGILRILEDDGTEQLYHDGSWDSYETSWALIPDEGLAAAVTCNADARFDGDFPAEELIGRWRS